MTDFNALAQRIVAQGVGDKNHADQYYAHFGINREWLTAKQFCNDGRVVLALMEKVTDGEWIHDGEGWHASTMKPMSNIAFTGVDESLAIAIELACLNARENSNDS